jgi:hypothetical protein
MYNPHRILELVQDQLHGKPLPPGYLKLGVAQAVK